MNPMPQQLHGLLDYVLGALLIAAPWVFDFMHRGPETWVPVMLGAAVFIYCPMTDYEWGAIGYLDMEAHLGLEIVLGLALMASPVLFDFAQTVWVPHVVLGLTTVVLAVSTADERVSFRSRPRPPRRAA